MVVGHRSLVLFLAGVRSSAAAVAAAAASAGAGAATATPAAATAAPTAAPSVPAALVAVAVRPVLLLLLLLERDALIAPWAQAVDSLRAAERT